MMPALPQQLLCGPGASRASAVDRAVSMNACISRCANSPFVRRGWVGLLSRLFAWGRVQEVGCYHRSLPGLRFACNGSVVATVGRQPHGLGEQSPHRWVARLPLAGCQAAVQFPLEVHRVRPGPGRIAGLLGISAPTAAVGPRHWPQLVLHEYSAGHVLVLHGDCAFTSRIQALRRRYRACARGTMRMRYQFGTDAVPEQRRYNAERRSFPTFAPCPGPPTDLQQGPPALSRVVAPPRAQRSASARAREAAGAFDAFQVLEDLVVPPRCRSCLKLAALAASPYERTLAVEAANARARARAGRCIAPLW